MHVTYAIVMLDFAVKLKVERANTVCSWEVFKLIFVKEEMHSVTWRVNWITTKIQTASFVSISFGSLVS